MTTTYTSPIYIDKNTFQTDVDYLESLLQRRLVGNIELPLIDTGQGPPLVFGPVLEHLEFVYARQVRFFSRERRIILYRRHETRTHFTSLHERVEELRLLLNHLEIVSADLLGHGNAAMVLLEFAIRYPQRCRSLTIISQGAVHRVQPYPLIWLLHELYLRLPLEHVLPTDWLQRTTINRLVARQPENERKSLPQPRQLLSRALIEDQFNKIKIWPSVYKFSVLPIIHRFNISERLPQLSMPVLLINRFDDALVPERQTRWMAEHLPNCAGYYLVPGGERFFLYSEAESINPLIQRFITRRNL